MTQFLRIIHGFPRSNKLILDPYRYDSNRLRLKYLNVRYPNRDLILQHSGNDLKSLNNPC